MQLTFDTFAIDTDRIELVCGGAVVPVEPKVFELICTLAGDPGRVFSRDEIIQRVWDGRIVSDATVSTAVKAARRALGDDGQRQNVIRTVHGRGFSLLAGQPNGALAAAPRRSYVQPSLIIPPGEGSKLAEDVTDAIRAALRRLPLVNVLSRRAAAAVAGKAPAEIAEDLGPGYLLDVHASDIGSETTLHAELSETGSGRLVWSRSVDLRDASDTTARAIAELLPRVEPALMQANLEALRGNGGAGGDDPRPYVIEALSVTALKGWHRESFAEAEAALRTALKLDPNLAVGRALLALILALGQRVGFEKTSPDRLNEATDHAEIAMSLEPMDSTTLGLAACALADAGHAKRALPILEKASELDPANAHAQAALGAARLQVGDVGAAVKHLRKGIAMSPFDNRLSIWMSILALAELKTGDPDSALATARRAVAVDDKTYLSRLVLTAVLLDQGDKDAAALALDDCLRVHPDLTMDEVIPVIGRGLGAGFETILVTAS
jgi:tetratricopeptide (TPR) repeat protein